GHAGRWILPDDDSLGCRGVWLRSSVLHLQADIPELLRRFLQGEAQHARHDAVTRQEGGGEQEKVRRQVPAEHRPDEGEGPTSRAQGGELRQPPRKVPFVHRWDMATEAHQFARTSRAAYAPSVP